MSQLIFLSGTIKLNGVVGQVVVSGSIPSALDIDSPVLTALSAVQAELDARIAAITVTPPPPPPPPATTNWGNGWTGYDATVAATAPTQSLNTFIAALSPAPADGATINLPAGVFAPGSLIENAAVNNTASTLTLIGAGATSIGTVFDGRGGVGNGFRLEWGESSILQRCQRGHISNIMFFRGGGADNTGDGEAGLRAYAGFTEYVEAFNNSYVVCEDGIFMPNGDFVTPPVPFLAGPRLFAHDSSFLSDGTTSDGKSHCLYVNGIRTDTLNLLINNNGHGYGIKTRSPDGTHINNLITSTADGAGYDFPQGGSHYIWGGKISSVAGAASQWLIRGGEEAVYGMKQPAGLNFVKIGGGCIIDNSRTAGNAIQAEAGFQVIFDSSCVFTNPTSTITILSEDTTGVVLFNQPTFPPPVVPSPLMAYPAMTDFLRKTFIQAKPTEAARIYAPIHPNDRGRTSPHINYPSWY